MSATLLPMRLVVKEMMTDWCVGAGVPVDLTRVPVTDLDGSRANDLRAALREIEHRVKVAHDAARASRPPRSTPHHEWHDVAATAADQAFALAAAAAGLIMDGVESPDQAIRYARRHPLVGRVWRILRSAIATCTLTRWEGMEEATAHTEALAADLGAMLGSAPVSELLPRRGPMTVRQVASHLGLSVRTVQDYRLDGRLPEPTMVGRTPTWTREQIDEWQANRPGQGARTDLRPKH